MATTAERILIPGRARVYLAPVGTPDPVDPNAAMPAAFTEVGHFADDSLTFTTDPSFEEVRSHQSDYPVRRYQTEDSATAEVDLHEWSAANLKAVFGGGNVVKLASGAYKYTPPTLGGRDEVMCVIKCTDGKVIGTSTDRTYMFVIPRAMQVEGVDISLNKSENAILPLRLAVLGADVGDAWYLINSDAPAFSDAQSTFTAITPTTGPAAGGTPVTITGTGLASVSGVLFGVTGTATAATATTITDSGATWTPGAFTGYTAEIVSGAGAGQTQAVTASDATSVTVGTAFSPVPDNTSVYRVHRPAQSFFTNPAGTTLSAVTPAGTTGQATELFLVTPGGTVDGGAASEFTYS